MDPNNQQIGQYQQPNQMGPPMGMPPVMLSQEEESAFDFWGVLNRRKWLVFLGLVSGIAIGALVYAKSETIYESVAAVHISNRKSSQRSEVEPIHLYLNRFKELTTR